MERRICTTSHVAADSEETEPTSEIGPDSPSCDDIKVEAPSPKKRKSMQKKVVSLPIGDVEGSKSKAETYPPSDSWAWRKYGQKPIKGSPYPRGYYRCSSAKGCPARKHVERSRADPTKVIVSYACEHNHPLPANKSSASTSASTLTKSSNSSHGPCSSGGATPSATGSSGPRSESEETLGHRDQPKLELQSSESVAVLLGEEFSWFGDASSTSVLESLICLEDDDVAWMTKEEDDSLFADLGELPECSAVFRRSRLSLSSSVIPCGGSTG